jgi:hypothetical protein
MAISVATLKAWVESLDPRGSTAIDDGGLSLVELTADDAETGAYLEIGGVPEKPGAHTIEFVGSELVVTMLDGQRIATPLDRYPRLSNATEAQRKNFRIMPMGIHWPDIDEDLSISGLLKAGQAR